MNPADSATPPVKNEFDAFPPVLKGEALAWFEELILKSGFEHAGRSVIRRYNLPAHWDWRDIDAVLTRRDLALIELLSVETVSELRDLARLRRTGISRLLEDIILRECDLEHSGGTAAPAIKAPGFDQSALNDN